MVSREYAYDTCSCGSRKKKTAKACRGCYLNKSKGVSYQDNYTYKSWSGMMYRCYNPKATSYKNYGSMGITVCIEWHDVLNFVRDMGKRPTGLSIDRINNKKGYSKDNCRWADASTQANNKREFYNIKTITGEKYISIDHGRYRVTIAKMGVYLRVGGFKTLDEAIIKRATLLKEFDDIIKNREKLT